MQPTPVYLDCNATTPIDPRVRTVMMPYFDEEFVNAGSRTHEYGNRAKVAVQRARDQVAALVDCQRDEVLLTSGATESNNLAILGLREFANRAGKRHIVTSAIEHKAVCEPCEELKRLGFEITYLIPNKNGIVSPEQLTASLREDTVLVSLMHVNNETGSIQPLSEYSRIMEKHEAFFHVDAAQGYGKLNQDLCSPSIHLISISGHKICGPKGIGALICRRRGFERIPLHPLFFGGGQERGLRPGTLAVPLIVGLGVASELAKKENIRRTKLYKEIREKAVKALCAIGGIQTVDERISIASTLSIRFPGIDSEALMVALKDRIAISNGAACTSQNYTESHVLKGMGLESEIIRSTIRLSWCHLTPEVDWAGVALQIQKLQ